MPNLPPTGPIQVITIGGEAGVITITNYSNRQISPELVRASIPAIDLKLESIKQKFIVEAKIFNFIIKDTVVFIPLVIIDPILSENYYRLETAESESIDKVYTTIIEVVLMTLIRNEMHAEGQALNDADAEPTLYLGRQSRIKKEPSIPDSPLPPITENDFDDILKRSRLEADQEPDEEN